MMINPAGKYVIVHHASPAIEPSQQAGPSIREYFELNRPTCFLLHDNRTRSDLSTADKVADLHPNQVAAPKFAVDREVKQRAISQAATLIEVEADFPNLFWLECAFRADGSSGIPDLPLDGCRFGYRISMIVLQWPERPSEERLG